MEQEQAAPAGAPQGQPGGEVGGFAGALLEVDGKLSKLTQAVGSNDKIPDEAKQAFGAALEAYRQGVELLRAASGGGQEEGGGAVAPEAGGARGAVPMSPAGVQR